MKFIIYGSGCSKCQQLTANAEDAARELNIPYEVKKITDMNAIITAGIMRTPALSINHDVVSEGKVASVDEIKKFLA
ncbi:MAG: thioredoxin family protein [Candidatus Scalindua sp.]|nr:thioredoxin family protein [Candidatus Scalindua sp.]